MKADRCKELGPIGLRPRGRRTPGSARDWVFGADCCWRSWKSARSPSWGRLQPSTRSVRSSERLALITQRRVPAAISPKSLRAMPNESLPQRRRCSHGEQNTRRTHGPKTSPAKAASSTHYSPTSEMSGVDSSVTRVLRVPMSQRMRDNLEELDPLVNNRLVVGRAKARRLLRGAIESPQRGPKLLRRGCGDG